MTEPIQTLAQLGFDVNTEIDTETNTPQDAVDLAALREKQRLAFEANARETAQVAFLYANGWTVIGPCFAWHGPISHPLPDVKCPVVDEFGVPASYIRLTLLAHSDGPAGVKDVDGLLRKLETIGCKVTGWVDPQSSGTADPVTCPHPSNRRAVDVEGELQAVEGDISDTTHEVLYCLDCLQRIEPEPYTFTEPTNPLPF